MSPAPPGPSPAPPGINAEPLLRVRGLEKRFPVRKGPLSPIRGWIRAVDGVSFDIPAGETLGLVGESGCGKTTVARAVLRLVEPTAGQVLFQGEDLLALNAASLRRRRRHLQMVFQDPSGSLNARMTAGAIIEEGLRAHGIGRGRTERRERVREAMARVGLDPAAVDRYPHEFSGGQRQRIGIARALAVEPKFIVCDEPVSALDVSIQSQVLNLLLDLRDRFGLTYLFIAHDLPVVEALSDRVAVMYLGKVVEVARPADLRREPLHPYTQALLAAVPSPDPRARRERAPLLGEVPSPLDPPRGCAFHPRCPLAREVCRREAPAELDLGGGRLVSCHVVAEELGKGAGTVAER